MSRRCRREIPRWENFARAGYVLVAAVLGACGGSSDASSSDGPASDGPVARPVAIGSTDEINPRLLRRFRPVDVSETRPASTATQIALGKRLFFDPSLSLHRDVSCNTCHPLDHHGTDNAKLSRGNDGQLGSRNTPTVFNAASHVAQFWDGRASTIEDQVASPMFNPREMAMPGEASVIARVRAAPYAHDFQAAFPGEPSPISMANVSRALGAFERGLVTRSRWDDYLAGNAAALSAGEKRGLRTFIELGCTSCHTGPQVGGTQFAHLGAVRPWPDQRDHGRGSVTNNPTDAMVFKVPGLKNVADTGPYFHDGSVDDLATAVRMMATYQLGIDASAADVDAIVTWLHAMSGTPDPAYIAPPSP